MDVSQIQGKPRWDEIKTAGYAGAVLRIRNSKGVDASWEYNYKSCGEQKLARGAYRYSYALTTAHSLSYFSLPDAQVGEMEHLHSFFKLYYFYSYLYGMYIKNILFKKLYLKKVR